MKINLGIIGAGWIAGKMAETLTGLGNPDICLYAISSRDHARARAFADGWAIPHAYGSYEELLADPEVNLVYIATPHSHHYAHARLAIEAGKAVAANAVMIGAVAAMKGFPLEKDILLETLKEQVPEKFRDLNIKAFEMGYSHIANQ